MRVSNRRRLWSGGDRRLLLLIGILPELLRPPVEGPMEAGEALAGGVRLFVGLAIGSGLGIFAFLFVFAFLSPPSTVRDKATSPRPPDDARQTIEQAAKDRAAPEQRTETAKAAMDGARRLHEREALTASKEPELKKREQDLAFRERHIEDLYRKADADTKAAAATRSDLERRLAAIRRAARE